jgi:site-specific recombinase XerD
MSQLVRTGTTPVLPSLVAHAGERASVRFLEVFVAQIRNSHTRRAYARAVSDLLAWCESVGVTSLSGVTPMHVAAYVEQLGRTHSKPTVKQHLAAIRMLFDWLVTGHIMESNPAHAVRGPKYSVRKGKTSVLSAEEMHELLAAIDTSSLLGLRDRALIALMGYTFARVGVAMDEGRRLLRAETPRLGAAAREGRQGYRASLPSQPGPVT